MDWSRLNPLGWFGSRNGHSAAATAAQQPPPMPAPPDGLLAGLRDRGQPWSGPSDTMTEGARELERDILRTGPQGVRIPNFLPYFDDRTHESSAKRREYRVMVADPVVKPSLFGKILSVAALDLAVHPAHKKDERSKHIADWNKWNFTENLEGGLSGLVWSVLLGGLVDGYSICVPHVEPVDRGKYAGLWGLSEVRPIMVDDDAVLITDEFKRVVGVQGLRYNAGEEFAPERLLIYTHQPMYGQPTGMSDLSCVYKAYWYLDTAWKLRIIGVEKRAFPIPIGHWKEAKDKTALDVALGGLSSRNWLNVPESAQVEVLNIAGSADAIFESTCRGLMERIVYGIEGATLQSMTGGVGQQRGSSAVHQDKAAVFKWWLQDSFVAQILNSRRRGLIVLQTDLNFVVSEYPRATLSAVDTDEQKARLGIFQGANGMGVNVSLEQFRETMSLEAPDDQDPEDVLAGKKDTPPGGPGGGAPPGGMPFVERFSEEHWHEAGVEQFAAASAHRKIGEVWLGAGGKRYFTRNSLGKVVPAKNPAAAAKAPVDKKVPKASAAAKAPAAPKATVDSAHALIEKHRSEGGDPKELHAHLDQLTTAQLGELKKKLGFTGRGQAISGVKAAQIKGIADKALALAKEKVSAPASAPAVPPTAPVKKPTAAAKPAVKKPAAVAKPAAVKPVAPAPVVPKVEPQHVADAVRSLDKTDNNLVSIEDVRKYLAGKGLTDRKAQDVALKAARDAGAISLGPIEGGIDQRTGKPRVTPEHLASAIDEDLPGGNKAKLGMVSVRPPRK